MPGIPESTIEEIRQRLDIVALLEGYVQLKRRGNDYWACCPFHHEKTPSFKVSPQHQTYYCFGCKKSGNAFSFVMEKENIDFVGAVRLLAQRYGITIPEPEAGRGAKGDAGQSRDRLYEVLKAAAEWYRQVLLQEPEAERARAYLRSRGVPDDVAARFGLGYSFDAWDAALRWGQRHRFPPELLLESGLLIERERDPHDPRDRGPGYDRFRGRLMFPIWDELGRVVGFSGRILEKDAAVAKYVNSPETPLFHKSRLLYALHIARPSFKDRGHALICEGQLDVIACHRAGLTNAVAPQGTAFTEQHAALLRRFATDIVFAFDADPAGIQAALRSFEVALATGLRPRVVLLPDDEDPDSLYRKHGGDALAAALGASQDPVAFLFHLATQENDAASAEGRARIVERVLGLVMLYPDPVTRAGHAQWLAHSLKLPEGAVLGRLEEMFKAKARGGLRPTLPGATAAPAPAPLTLPADPIAVAERTLLGLVLRERAIAEAVQQRLAPESISGSPVGRALNHVLGMTLEGEWEAAGAELAKDMELAADPGVGEARASEAFAPPEGIAEDGALRAEYQRRLRRAMDDCLARLAAERLTRELAEVQAAAVREPDPHRRAALLERFQELARQLRESSRGGAAQRPAAAPVRAPEPPASAAAPPPPARPAGSDDLFPA